MIEINFLHLTYRYSCQKTVQILLFVFLNHIYVISEFTKRSHGKIRSYDTV